MSGGIGMVARGAPDLIALATIGRAVTFAELDDRHRRLAGALRETGLSRGDRIAVFATNSPASLEVTTGALRAGIVPVPINPLSAPREVAYVLEDSDATWLFTDRTVEPIPGLERIVSLGSAYERMLTEATPVDIADHALGRPMHYTSGTTGMPKGVWVEPYDEDEALARSVDFRRYWDLRGGDVHLVCSPLAHSAPHRYSLRTLEAGGTVVVQSHFDAAETMAAVELFGITTTFMVPTHIERILALGRTHLARHDLSSLRLLIHAGAPIRTETKEGLLQLVHGGRVWEFYGSTEGHFTRISEDDWRRKPGSVGTPRDGARLVVTDDDGVELEPGETGQVWIDDPNAEPFVYWGDEDKTEEAWSGSAFSVGDLGYADDDGYLFLVGRRNDVIISGGVNVYPQEVEAVLVEHPSIAEAVVFGIPDEEWGQRVGARLVLDAETTFDEAGFDAWMKERLAGYKRPRSLEIVEELERTATGKVRRPNSVEG